MTANRTYKHGDYLVQCDRSGFTCYASECKKTWDGFFVKKEFWEPRHPQDFVRSREDDTSVEIPRQQVTVDLVDGEITADDL